MEPTTYHLPLWQSRKAVMPCVYKLRFGCSVTLIAQIIFRLQGSKVWGDRLSWVGLVGSVPVESFLFCSHIDKILTRRGWKRAEAVSKTSSSCFRMLTLISHGLGTNCGTHHPLIWWLGKGHRSYGVTPLKGFFALHALFSTHHKVYNAVIAARSGVVLLGALSKQIGLNPRTCLYMKLSAVCLNLLRVNLAPCRS